MTSSIYIDDLKCEYLKNPLGIDAARPRFSWKLRGLRNGVFQSAYRIVVSGSGEVLWDSGRCECGECVGIEYAGKPLSSAQRCTYRVSVWDQDGSVSESSGDDWFETGLMSPEDWKGCFIGFPGYARVSCSQFLRQDFDLAEPPAKARAYVCVPGYFEFYVNGVKMGDAVLEPAASEWSKTLYYVTYDITPYLQKGRNVFAVVLGNSLANHWYWYRLMRLLFQAYLTFADGRTLELHSAPDTSWTGTTFPISYCDVYGGETYDSRFERAGWNLPNDTFEKSLPFGPWHFYASILPEPNQTYEGHSHVKLFFSRFRPLRMPHPGGVIRAQMVEPIKVMRSFTPVSVTTPKPSVYVADMGENMAGWIKLNAKGDKGKILSIKYAEVLYEDGENKGLLNRESLSFSAEPIEVQRDRYVFTGQETGESYEPRFTYHGFRYAQIEGLDYCPDVSDIMAQKVYSSVEEIGSFTCSDPLLNQILANYKRTETSNLHSIPTDCPQRTERCGWLNDMTVRAEAAVYNYGLNNLYHKWMQDIHDAQDHESGAITDTAPFHRGLAPAAPVSSSYLIAAWACYEHYGNKKILSDFYDGFKAWAEYLYDNSSDGIVNYSYYGDWCPPIEFGYPDARGLGVSRITPGPLVATAYCAYNFILLAKIAKALDRLDDVTQFERKAHEITQSYNRHFFDDKTIQYMTGNQSSNAISLYMGFVPKEHRQAVADKIAQDLRKHDMHFTSGNLCTRYIAELMSEYGYIDDIYEVMTKRDYPSYGYMIENGATTIWERWENKTGKAMNSHNHPMFGSVCIWFYKHIAGIRPCADQPGYKHILIEPRIPSKLTFADCSIETVRGRLVSNWKKEQGRLSFHIEIPVCSTAELIYEGRSWQLGSGVHDICV